MFALVYGLISLTDPASRSPVADRILTVNETKYYAALGLNKGNSAGSEEEEEEHDDEEDH